MAVSPLRTLVAPWAALAALAACGGSAAPTPPRTVFGGARPATLQVPSAYDGVAARPLLVVLHGYGASGAVEAAYLGTTALVESAGIFVIAPDGTTDATGAAFWNATDACCNFNGSTVDDVAYVKGLIADIRHDYKIDPKRITLWGHSNGAFMAHRLACEDSLELAGIVSLAGATWQDPARCAPSGKVSLLSIHGDADATILYGGGAINANAYPSEQTSTARWAAFDGCTPGIVDDPTLIDIEKNLTGAETQISRFAGCQAGTGVELWTIQGGSHTPRWATGFAARAWAWLDAHPRQ